MEGGGAESERTTWTCSVHGALPISEFHKSEVLYGNHRCKQCACARAARYHKEAPEVWIASESRSRERARMGGEAAVTFTAADAAEVLRRFGHTCCATGAVGKPLTIIPIDPRLPLSAANGAPVCRRIAAFVNTDMSAGRRVAWLGGGAATPGVGDGAASEVGQG